MRRFSLKTVVACTAVLASLANGQTAAQSSITAQPPIALPVVALPTIAAPTLIAPAAAEVDTPRVRAHAIDYSDAYNTRLTIHRWGSYVMLPLFAGEWYLGNTLLTGVNPPDWMKPAHAGVAGAIGVLFGVNTLTGGWNLWDSRSDPNDRTRRYLHAGLMLASDAGFVWAGALGGQSKRNALTARRHRDVALGSIGMSTAGTVMMWLWRK